MTERPTKWAGRPAFINHAEQPPACRGHNPDLWFRRADEQEAIAICATCPHQDACRTWAYAQPIDRLYGVWGGTTQADRRNHHRRTTRPSTTRSHTTQPQEHTDPPNRPVTRW